jgi:Raf kinase inhibitor-like YbhB/YbcL family protein
VDLSSAAFTDHTLIPERHSYGGGNVSPPLEWSGIPGGAEELALLCEDPDAPGGTFVHWVVTNISPKSTGMEEGALPPGALVGRNGFDELGWGGPHPPAGDQPHRYRFQLYATDRPLALGEGADADEVHALLAGCVLDRATLVGLFGR